MSSLCSLTPCNNNYIVVCQLSMQNLRTVLVSIGSWLN